MWDDLILHIYRGARRGWQQWSFISVIVTSEFSMLEEGLTSLVFSLVLNPTTKVTKEEEDRFTPALETQLTIHTRSIWLLVTGTTLTPPISITLAAYKHIASLTGSKKSVSSFYQWFSLICLVCMACNYQYMILAVCIVYNLHLIECRV